MLSKKHAYVQLRGKTHPSTLSLAQHVKARAGDIPAAKQIIFFCGTFGVSTFDRQIEKSDQYCVASSTFDGRSHPRGVRKPEPGAECGSSSDLGHQTHAIFSQDRTNNNLLQCCGSFICLRILARSDLCVA